MVGGVQVFGSAHVEVVDAAFAAMGAISVLRSIAAFVVAPITLAIVPSSRSETR